MRGDLERARILIEESREIVLVLDADRRVVAASRRAGSPSTASSRGRCSQTSCCTLGGRTPHEIPYALGGRRETLLYLSAPGDLAAYQELRAGFTAAVSHELRTPLARLLALLESALLPGADQADLIGRSRTEVLRIGELIDDVLFLSELESGRAVVSLGSIRALPVLDRVVAEVAERASIADLKLKVDCTASFELPLRARMLQVVVENLIENVIRYAGTGQPARSPAAKAPQSGASSSPTTAPAWPRTSCRVCSSGSTAQTTPGRRSARASGSPSSSTSSLPPLERSRRPQLPAVG